MSKQTQSSESERRTAIANIITGRLSPLGKLEAIDELFTAYASTQREALLDELESVFTSYTAKHDQPMRDEVLDYIDTMRTDPKNTSMKGEA